MTDGEESRSRTIECSPDEVFSCGSIMEIEGVRWRIRALHTGKGRTLRGKRQQSTLDEFIFILRTIETKIEDRIGAD